MMKILPSGRWVDLENLSPGDIDIVDISYSLSRVLRMLGWGPDSLSVAQHSVAVAALVPLRLGLPAMLHDAHEYVMGDIPTPVKEAVPQIRELQNRIQSVIHRKFGIVLTDDDVVEIKEADKKSGIAEMSWAFSMSPAECVERFGSEPDMSVILATGCNSSLDNEQFLESFRFYERSYKKYGK